MTLERLPEEIQKEIFNLTKDEQFQKIFAEDEVLDKLLGDTTPAVNSNTLTYQQDYRICQLVANYLVDNNKLWDIKMNWIRKLIKYLLIKDLLNKNNGDKL